ncbi:murein biosynthesis integral membrane protein MurJ [Gloeobacter violaceus]|uniref:Probable lipid II flippase MurJ n=1 Tax=Gloeobacter violaceus (strain ATCC 29082 / PCC 7421) TaxID=251221 RepID=Q7NKK6_GLOVI|nr:murein biosynthesis integral membrane protein MurJ [Gloeobacter violaceus]BAC89412.1 gll1471 [Gloeobacter violaceus PCC 7421]
MGTTRRSLLGVAGLVGAATVLSKFIALFREQFIAASFGVSAGVDAYNYAYKLPGFLLTLLGGVNGPFYSAVLSVVSKQDRSKVAPLIENVQTLVAIALGGATALLWLGAPWFIGLVAAGAAEPLKQMAVEQLRIMAPMALFAGLIGLGFGVLTAADRFAFPSLSPILSSGAVIAAIGAGYWVFGLGPEVLAWGSLAGAILQWLVQIPLQWQLGLGGLRPRFQWNRPEVREVIDIMGPATGSSLLSNLNVYTNLFFASQLPVGVPSALNYANLLVQTPLGIFSNILLVPTLPLFARLSAEADRPELRLRVRQAVVSVLIVVLPMSVLATVLAGPLVSVVYERGQFDNRATLLVATVFAGQAVGMAFYLVRDLLIRVFYALGEARVPLRISAVGIVVNLLAAWLLSATLGALGLALSTSFVSAFACILLVFALRTQMGGLGWGGLGWTATNLLAGALLAGAAAWGVNTVLAGLWTAGGIVEQLVRLTVAGAAGVLIQVLWLRLWRIPEVMTLLGPLTRRLRRRS